MHRIKKSVSGDLTMIRPLIPLSPNVLSAYPCSGLANEPMFQTNKQNLKNKTKKKPASGL
jgi:hypothetical protein